MSVSIARTASLRDHSMLFYTHPSTGICKQPSSSPALNQDGFEELACEEIYSTPSRPPEAIFKILVVGYARCGKTSVINRFSNQIFDAGYKSTIGVDFVRKDVEVATRMVRLQLWDIAGQDRFAKLTRAYFRNANGVIIVCDVTREGSYA